MFVKVVVGVTVFLVATIAIARGIRAADWALMLQMPNREWHLADGHLVMYRLSRKRLGASVRCGLGFKVRKLATWSQSWSRTARDGAIRDGIGAARRPSGGGSLFTR